MVRAEEAAATFFFITTGKEIFKTAGDKHKKEGNAGQNGDNLKDIVKDTFQTLNTSNIGGGGNAIIAAGTAAGPSSSSLGQGGERENKRKCRAIGKKL